MGGLHRFGIKKKIDKGPQKKSKWILHNTRGHKGKVKEWMKTTSMQGK